MSVRDTHPLTHSQPGPRRRPGRRFVVVALLAVVAVLAGLGGPTAWSEVTGAPTTHLSAKDRIAADPPPPLFPADQVAGTAADVAAQDKQASSLVATWVSTHGTERDDKAFVTWIEQVFPAPPADLRSEMPVVVALEKRRTARASPRRPGWRRTARRTSGSSTCTTRRRSSRPRPAPTARPRRRPC